MKLKLAVITGFVVSNFCSAFVYSQNLIKNGGFEDTDTACINSYPLQSGKPAYGFGPIDCITPWGEYTSTQLVFHHPDGIFKGASAAAVLLWSSAYSERRTYVVGPLCRSLTAGARYRVTFHYKLHTPQQFSCGGLSVAFDNGEGYQFNKVKDRTPVPVFTINELLPDTGWRQADFTYKANGTETLIVIGNFLPDAKTPCKKIHPKEKPWPYVYGLIDELSVVGLDGADTCTQPVLQVKHSFTETPFDTAATYILSNVFFEHNSFRLLSSSYRQINELADYLNTRAEVKAIITGHTDNTGTEQFNRWLSEQRALAVVQALIEKGISSLRLTYEGKGETMPLENNSTESGKALNRRVEVTLVR